jgi:Type IV secretory pathway, VirB10 components
MALPAPPPPETQLSLPPPNDDEARRLAELERQRQEEERRRWERFRAPQVITDHTNQSDQSANPDEATRSGAAQDDDSNRRFLASVSNAGVEVAKATQNHRIDALVAQGTMIRGVLETALQSDLPGMVRAVTAENVWSFDGRRVLIPPAPGSSANTSPGSARDRRRVFIVWTRLCGPTACRSRSARTARTISAALATPVRRQSLPRALRLGGRAFARRWRLAVSQLLRPKQQWVRQRGLRYDGSYHRSRHSAGGNQQLLQARQIAAQNVSQSLTNIAQEALKNSINIPPTIYLDQGTKIIVFVRRDLDFSSLYPDPVKEALRELRHEHAGGTLDRFSR